MDFLRVLATIFAAGTGVVFLYALVLAIGFFQRANQALDMYLAEKAHERYANWPGKRS